MNFEQFKYLSEIHKNKSISKASEKLYMSTQALSISIKNLEDELKVPLLLRSQKGATLTPEGEKILEAYSLFRAKLIDIAAEYAHQTDDKAEFYFLIVGECIQFCFCLFVHIGTLEPFFVVFEIHFITPFLKYNRTED